MIVSFKTAKLAKEKGFTEAATHVYTIGFGNIKEDPVVRKYGNYGENEKLLQLVKIGKGQPHLAVAPTQSELAAWLRDVHNIETHVWAEGYVRGINWLCQAINWNNDKGSMVFGDTGDFSSYEDALEECLVQGLNLIPCK